MKKLPNFKWRNCYGDVICARFDGVVRAYWEKVALPALQSAESEVQFWANSGNDADVFMYSDMLDQHLVTAAAMCLSLQSIWERQLRAYLLACALEPRLEAQLIRKLQHDQWDKLQIHFQRMRGVPLQAFLSFPDLDLLVQMGNVCRHGAGRAANQLWRTYPELWPYSGSHNQADMAPPVEHMHIGTPLLRRLAGAIEAFWQMIGYLYRESITRKHISLERRLPAERQQHVVAIEHFNRIIAGKTTAEPAD